MMMRRFNSPEGFLIPITLRDVFLLKKGSRISLYNTNSKMTTTIAMTVKTSENKLKRTL